MSNGFTFGGVHSDAFGLIVNSKDLPLTPPLNNRLQENGGHDGAWDYGVEYGARIIELDCTLFSENASDLRKVARQFAGAMNPAKGARSLVFDDEPDVQYFARVSNQIPLAQLGAMGTFTLQLTCPDPFTYSTEYHSVTTTGTTEIDHAGAHIARPRITVTHGGGVGAIDVVGADMKATMVFDESSEAGTYIIDSKVKTITVSGKPAYDFVKGSFITLSEGLNTVTITGGINSVKIEYHDTWL